MHWQGTATRCTASPTGSKQFTAPPWRGIHRPQANHIPIHRELTGRKANHFAQLRDFYHMPVCRNFPKRSRRTGGVAGTSGLAVVWPFMGSSKLSSTKFTGGAFGAALDLGLAGSAGACPFCWAAWLSSTALLVFDARAKANKVVALPKSSPTGVMPGAEACCWLLSA